MAGETPSGGAAGGKGWVWLLPALAAGLVLRAILFHEPPGRDQGIFLTIGEMISDGFTLYREAWDHKPPLIYFIYALIVRFPGGWKWAGPGADALFHAAAAVFLYFTVRRLRGERAGALGAGLYFVLSAGQSFGGYWGKLQAEVVLNALTAAAAYLTLLSLGEGKKAGTARLGLGLLGCMGALLKLNAVVLFAGFVLLVAAARFRSSGLRGLRQAAAQIAAGAALGSAPFFVYLAAHRALGDAWETVVVFNLKYVGAGGPQTPGLVSNLFDYIAMVFRFVEPVPLILSTLAVLFITMLRCRRWETQDALLPLWLAGSFALFVSGRWLFPYHALPLVLPAAALTAVGMHALWRRLGSRPAARTVVFAGAAGLFAVAFLLGSLGVLVNNLRHLAGDLGREPYYATYQTYAKCRHISGLLLKSRKIQPGDRIVIWSYDALIYQLTGTMPASRFVCTTPLNMKRDPLRESLRKAFLEELAAHPPKAVVVAKGQRQFYDPRDDAEKLLSFSAFNRYLRGRYRLELSTSDFDVYFPAPGGLN